MAAAGLVLVTGCARRPFPSASRAAVVAADSTSASSTGKAVTPPATRGPAVHPVRFLGRLTHRYEFLQTTIAPPGDAEPAINWPQAFAACRSRFGPACGSNGGPDISLAVVSSPTPAQVQPDGTTRPLLHGTLSYVMTWTDEHCVPSGPVQPAGSPAPATLRCILVAFVDAHTGHGEFSESCVDIE